MRLLTSAHFDSRSLLSVVLAGDGRLPELFRREELRPLGSRIRSRLTLEYATRDAVTGNRSAGDRPGPGTRSPSIGQLGAAPAG